MVSTEGEPATDPHFDPPSRSDRLSAIVTDVGWGLLLLFLAGLLAFLWLFLRTGFGARHVDDGDSVIAAALVGAAIPAWLTWLGLRAALDGATRGQRRARLHVEVVDGRPAPRLLRLLVHPLSIPGWLWFAGLSTLIEAPWLPVLLTLVAVTIAIMMLVTIALLVADPAAPALHDRIAGTRLVRSRRGSSLVRGSAKSNEVRPS